MVAKIKFVKSLSKVLSYNEKKVREEKAELLCAAGFPRDMEQLSFRDKMALFRKLYSKNQRSDKPIVHLTLNFHPKDKLDKGMLVIIAHEYIQGIGLGGQPFLVYRHFDAGHPHIHIATTKINKEGKRIYVYDKGFKRSADIKKEMERTYGLIRVQDHMGKTLAQGPPEQTVKLERVQYGSGETRAAVNSIVSEVVKSYKFAALTDFNEILNQFGVVAYTGVPGSQMRASGGVVYWVLNAHDKMVGVPIRSRFIDGKPTLKKLEKRFNQNSIRRRPLGQRLKNLLDKSLNTTKSQQEMTQFLRGHGIRAVFREDSQEKLSGVTYIDNATRTAYNGLDLGRKYHAPEFYRAIQDKPRRTPGSMAELAIYEDSSHQDLQTASQGSRQEPASPAKFIPAQDLPVIQVLADKFYFDHEQTSQLHQQRQLAMENKQRHQTRELER